MSKLSSSTFCHSTQRSMDALIVSLLWKPQQMPSCSTNNANLDKTNFDMSYIIIDCCAAINGQIWMNKNNVANKSRLIMLSWLKSVLLYHFYQFREILSQTRFSFYATQSSHLLKTWKRVILTCFTKMIAEQSSVIQYAWPMCHNERGIIIILSFPDICFVILLFVFQRFEIKSGFLVFTHTV